MDFVFYVFLVLLRLEDVLSHVLNYDSVTVCNGILKEIQCPPLENIHVLQGFYGKWRNHNCKGETVDPDNIPTCRSDRSMVNAKVKDLCQGKNKCTLVADDSIYGAPCTNNRAYLYMTFFCMKNGQKLIHHKTQNDMEVVTVPSHGFIIREETVHLEEQRQQKEQEEAKRRADLSRLNIQIHLQEQKRQKEQMAAKQRAELTRITSQKKAQEARLKQELQEKRQQQERKLTFFKQTSLDKHQHREPTKNNLLSSLRPTPEETAPIFNSVEEAKAIENAIEASSKSNVEQNRHKKTVKDKPVETDKNEEQVLAKQKSMIYDFLLRSQIPKNKSTGDSKTNFLAKDGDIRSKSSHANVKKDEDLIQPEHIKHIEIIKQSAKNVHESTDIMAERSSQPEKSATTSTSDSKQTISDLRLDKVSEQLEKIGTGFTGSVINETSQDVRSSIICNGESKVIACLPEEGIQILDAFYGKRIGEDCHGKLPYQDDAPTCSALDARMNVEKSCNNKQSCMLSADENVYGKSLCPNVNKYLWIQYTCSPLPDENDAQKDEVVGTSQVKDEIPNITNETINALNVSNSSSSEDKSGADEVSQTLKQLSIAERKNNTELLCNGQVKPLTCDKEVGLAILSAFYGKKAGKDCRGELGYRDDIPECSNPRVFDTVKKACDGHKSCEISSEKDLYGKDECPGVNKYLEVVYAC